MLTFVRTQGHALLSIGAIVCIAAVPWAYLLSLLFFSTSSLASVFTALLVFGAAAAVMWWFTRAELFGVLVSVGVGVALLLLGYYRDQLLWAPLTGTAFELLSIMPLVGAGFVCMVGRLLARIYGVRVLLWVYVASAVGSGAAYVALGFFGTHIAGTGFYAYIASALLVALYLAAHTEEKFRNGAFLCAAFFALLFLAVQDGVLVGLALGALVVWSVLSREGRLLRISVLVYACVAALLFAAGVHTQLAPLYIGLEAEVRPSLTATLYTATAFFQHGMVPAFFTGAGSFLEVWNVFRPEAVGLSYLWHADSAYAVSLFTTYIVMYGIPLSIAALYAYLVYAFRAVRGAHGTRALQGALLFLAGGVFVASVPDTVFFYSVFFLCGVLWVGVPPPAASWVSIVRPVVLVVVAGLFAIIGARLYALTLLDRAVAAQDNPEVARTLLLQSVALSPTTEALGSLVRLDIQESDRRIAQAGATEADVQELNDFLRGAVARAQALVELNPHDFKNWIDAGGILLRDGLRNPDTAESVLSTLENAVVRGRARPEAFFLLAVMQYQYGNTDKARLYLEQSLRLKYDYKEARDFLDAHPELRQ